MDELNYSGSIIQIAIPPHLLAPLADSVMYGIQHAVVFAAHSMKGIGNSGRIDLLLRMKDNLGTRVSNYSYGSSMHAVSNGSSRPVRKITVRDQLFRLVPHVPLPRPVCVRVT